MVDQIRGLLGPQSCIVLIRSIIINFFLNKYFQRIVLLIGNQEFLNNLLIVFLGCNLSFLRFFLNRNRNITEFCTGTFSKYIHSYKIFKGIFKEEDYQGWKCVYFFNELFQKTSKGRFVDFVEQLLGLESWIS